MSRLRHGYKAYIATFRMTQNSLVVFFEGKENDPIFYTRIKQRYETQTGHRIELRRASELPRSSTGPGGSGGKGWLLRVASFWESYYANRKPPVQCSILLALDKDVDDIFPAKAPNVKIIRTQGYSVENHMILGCDLEICVTAAFSLLNGEVATIINPNQNAWQFWAVQLWSEWITYCLIAKSYRPNNLHGYSRRSKFNQPFSAPAPPANVEAEFEKLRVAVNVDHGEFAGVRKAASDYVQQTITNGTYQTIFKGEWFIDILFSQLRSDPQIARNSVQSGIHGIWSAIRTNYSLDQPTYDYYKNAFDNAQMTIP